MYRMEKAKEAVFMVEHSIAPVFDSQSRILILGTFPSVKSRETKFFYGHKQNRFWKVLAALFCKEVPEGTEQKKEFLLTHHIALWDVIASCTISKSSDASIKDVVPNDLSIILDTADIQQIFVNGAKAQQLYNRYLLKQTGIKAIKLPSTSPANASCSLPNLIESWKVILSFLN